MKSNKLFASILAAAVFLPSLALAQTTTLDQVPAPLGNTGASEILTQSLSVPGGALYITTAKQAGQPSGPSSIAQTFVPGAATAQTRYFALTNGKLTTGLPMSGTTGSGTSFGVARTAGTSLNLVGTATSSSATTNKVLFEFNLADTYVAGANIPIIINCGAAGGTITAVSTTMTVVPYTETNGVEAAVTVSAAQQIPAVAANLTFTVTGTGLVPGQHVLIELTMLVTTSAGAGTGTVYSVAYQG